LVRGGCQNSCNRKKEILIDGIDEEASSTYKLFYREKQ